MNVPTRLAAFAAVLGLTFGGAALVGAAIDPTDDEPVGQHAADAAGQSGHDGGGTQPGLAVSDGGFTLDAHRELLRAGEAAPFTFRITDESGQPVREGYELEQEKELHLIVVRRDTADFQHLHPARASDGTWSVDLTLPEPGVYRAYADFQIDGEKRTLGTDLFVPGDFQPRPLPATEPVVRVAASGGPLDVALDAPRLEAGREALITFTVRQGEQPYVGLDPYLGAKGHLVALRQGDLAYLHVHPVDSDPGHGEEPGGDEIAFAALFPTPGTYRLFLQFNAAGEIRTAPFTVDVRRPAREAGP